MKVQYTYMLVALLATISFAGCGTQQDQSNVTNTEDVITTENVAEVENILETECAIETEECNDTIIEEVSTEASTEIASNVSEETSAETTSTFSYTDMSSTMYAIKSVNVRNAPNTDGEKLGSLSINDGVTITGQCIETGWYRIDYNGQTGYVSNSYLSDNQVDVAETTDTAVQASSQSNSSHSSNMLNVTPEGNYVPSAYTEGGYTYLDLGYCIISWDGDKTLYSDVNLTTPVGTNTLGGSTGMKQCYETGAIYILAPEGDLWISGDGVRVGY